MHYAARVLHRRRRNPNGPPPHEARQRLLHPPQNPLDLIEQHSGKREIVRSLGAKMAPWPSANPAACISVALDDELEAVRRSATPAEPMTKPSPSNAWKWSRIGMPRDEP